MQSLAPLVLRVICVSHLWEKVHSLVIVDHVKWLLLKKIVP